MLPGVHRMLPGVHRYRMLPGVHRMLPGGTQYATRGYTPGNIENNWRFPTKISKNQFRKTTVQLRVTSLNVYINVYIALVPVSNACYTTNRLLLTKLNTPWNAELHSYSPKLNQNPANGNCIQLVPYINTPLINSF